MRKWSFNKYSFLHLHTGNREETLVWLDNDDARLRGETMKEGSLIDEETWIFLLCQYSPSSSEQKHHVLQPCKELQTLESSLLL